MKTFLYKLVIIIAVIFFVDYGAGIIFSKLYGTARSGLAYKENYIFNNSNEDILVFGSSRAEYHYIPEIIYKETGLSTYNVGREGAGIFFHYSVLLATVLAP